jgi:hypothetical protein
MTPDELRKRCWEIMLQLDLPDENAAMNAGDKLAKLLGELTGSNITTAVSMKTFASTIATSGRDEP